MNPRIVSRGFTRGNIQQAMNRSTPNVQIPSDEKSVTLQPQSTGGTY